jgi:hypothetical protein
MIVDAAFCDQDASSFLTHLNFPLNSRIRNEPEKHEEQVESGGDP